MAFMDNFTWIDFYVEFADKLRAYVDDRKILINKIIYIFDSINMKLPTLEKDNNIFDIDPFTIFGLFNKHITNENRINLLNAFAKELAPNITVNAIAPGNIDTDMTRGAGKELVDWVIDNTPMKRLGEPEEVAYLVSFLASDKSSFITGQIIEVAGGYDLR